MRALIVGWFSYEGSDATAGDLLASDVVREWLSAAGIASDIALASPFPGGVDVSRVNPADYGVVVFVCGPFMRSHWEAAFLGQFADSVLVGVNLSMRLPLDEWQPFDRLFERDSVRTAWPDLVYGSREARVPVIGDCRVEPYGEADVPAADAAIDRLLRSREMAVVPIDTRLDVNRTGLRTKAEVESLVARMDAVVTTRLHGMVLSLKHGVPPVVIDPEVGGGRIRRQAEAVGWPAVTSVDVLSDAALDGALGYCLSAAGRLRARTCAEHGTAGVAAVRERFLAEIGGLVPDAAKPAERRAFAAACGWTPSERRRQG
jgi:hypothetical protein